jgi:hypothetical protein
MTAVFMAHEGGELGPEPSARGHSSIFAKEEDGMSAKTRVSHRNVMPEEVDRIGDRLFGEHNCSTVIETISFVIREEI